MCRLVAWVSDTPRTLTEVLGADAVQRLVHLSHVHADGWGAAWHDDSGALQVQLSATEAGLDEAFASLAGGLATTVGVVHLRLGSPGCGYGVLSNHPFVDGDWALAHNGAISPASGTDALIAPGSARHARGETDTERYFLALRDEMDAGASVPAAMDAVVARMYDNGLTSTSLNSMLLGPDALDIISWHDPQWQATTIPVWPAEDLARGITPPYYPMSYRADEALVVAVSSGIVADQTGWSPIPNHAVLRVDLASRALSTTAVRPRVSAA